MGDEASSASLKKKKLPFKPTALRKVAAAPNPTPVKDCDKRDDDDDDGLDLFRQSKEMAPIVAADRERRLRKKQKEEERQRQLAAAGDKRREEERDKEDTPQMPDAASFEEQNAVEDKEEEPEAPLLSEAVTVDDDGFGCAPSFVSGLRATAQTTTHRDLVTPPPSKRSRVGSAHGSRSSKRHRSSADETEASFDDSPSKRVLRSHAHLHAHLSTPSKKRPMNEVITPGGAPLIAIDSDSDSDSGVKPVEAPSERRQDSIEIVDPVAPAPPVEVVEEEDEFDEYVRKAEEQRARNRAMLQTDSSGAPKKSDVASIMITSNAPNAEIAHMKYQFDRPLRLVRDSWIAYQRKHGVPLAITQDDDVVLTWQRKKVYTYSTLLNLGIRPQGDGRIVADEFRRGGLVDGRTKVHLEAWTTDLFQEMEREEEMRQKREAGEDDGVPEEEPQAERVRLRVKLKARDLEEVKLTVLLETTVETLVTGFRTQRGIASDKDVGIWFDGERLEEHDTMESADIDDMDTLEVHIK